MSSTIDGLNHDRKTAMPAIAVSIEVVTSVLLWMRIGSRFTTARNTLGIDDALIVAGWIVGLGLTIAVLLGTEKYGLNRHIWDVPVENFAKGGLIGFIVEVLFFWSTCFTKVSVLMFYRRLVEGTVSKKFRLAIWAAIAFVIAYTISFFIVVVLSCRPVRAMWMQFDLRWRADNDFVCKSRETQVIIAKLVGALSVVTDFYSVLLPAALVLQIRISPRQRIGLFFIFGLGMLVVGAGIARTYYLGRVFEETVDKTWWTWDVFLASVVECNVAIICACAPSVKALFGRYYRNAASRYGSGSDPKGSYGSSVTASVPGNDHGKTTTQPDVELGPCVLSKHIKKDSAYQPIPPRKEHIIDTMRSHENVDDNQEISIAYDGAPQPSGERTTASRQTSKLFSTFPSPPGRKGDNQRVSFLETPTPSENGDDEIQLVPKAKYQQTVSTSDSIAPITRGSATYVSPDDLRSLSARSISPSMLSAETPYPDPLMPKPTSARSRDQRLSDRTNFPVI